MARRYTLSVAWVILILLALDTLMHGAPSNASEVKLAVVPPPEARR